MENKEITHRKQEIKELENKKPNIIGGSVVSIIGLPFFAIGIFGYIMYFGFLIPWAIDGIILGSSVRELAEAIARLEKRHQEQIKQFEDSKEDKQLEYVNGKWV